MMFLLVGDFNVARLVGGVHPIDFGTAAKRQANGGLFRCDFVVWQVRQISTCGLEQ
ncbi:MAG: hypothetical protein IH895_01780 [Planctomycetes bacterium]|nr:hypothetical protein [Planctomycetota bacterium]